MADETIKQLIEENQRLSELLKSTGALQEDLRKYAAVLGENIEVNITSAEDAKKVMQQLIDASMKKGQLDQNQKNILINIQQLLNSQLKINGDLVKLDKEHENTLKQIVKHRAEDYRYLLNSNIAAGKQLNIAKQIRGEKEEISKLSRSDAAYALAGMISNNALVNTFKTLLTTFSSMSAELNKMTLDGDRYARVAMSSADALAGVSYAESLSAQKELIQGMSTFTRMTEDAQKALVTTTAQFEKLGISAKNQAAMNQVATKSFGMSAKEASNFYSELVTFSKSANVPMAEIDKNLGAIGNKLALFGREKYQQVFKDLTVAAKDFGIEASKMLEVTERFTTFEGAAQAAGRLNAMLGGNFVSGLRLMNSALEDPIDVFRQLKTAMDMSGKEFANMSQAQKRYVAEKIGVSITEAENLFGNSLNESTQRLQERQATQKELNELSSKSTEVLQRLQIALLKIANSPFVEKIIGWIESLVGLVEWLGKADKESGGWIGGILTFIGALGLLAKSFVFLFGPIGSFIRFGFLIVQLARGKTAATIADIAMAPAAVAAENAKAAGLSVHTAALKANTIAMMQNARAGKAMKNVLNGMPEISGAAGLGMLKFAAIIVAVIAVVGAFIYVLGEMAIKYAEWNKQQAAYTDAQARLADAQTRQATAFKELGMSIKYMTMLKDNLTSFAEGIQQIAEAIELINLEKVSALNMLGSRPFDLGVTTTGTSTVRTEVVPVKVVEVEMQTTREEERQQMSLANRGKNEPKEVKLVINSPISLDGANWGRLISNGIAIYQDSLGREITSGLSSYSGKQILDG
jgi:hypothetical protein